MTPSVTENASLIVIDWGTTNRRAYLLDENGNVLDTRRDDRGILNLDPKRFAESFHEFIKDWRDKPVHELPVLMSGMIGSRQGWHEAPYVTCPVRQDDLVSALLPAPGAENCSIVPGVSLAPASTRHDVIEAKKSKSLARLANRGATPVSCGLPGTHSKWAKVENGQLVDFYNRHDRRSFSGYARSTDPRRPHEQDVHSRQKGLSGRCRCRRRRGRLIGPSIRRPRERALRKAHGSAQPITCQVS